MKLQKFFQATVLGTLCFGVVACGNKEGRLSPTGQAPSEFNNDIDSAQSSTSSFWDLFGGTPDQKVQVNRYLWNASLDVLEFLPVQSVDPFTGVIATGYGTPPGSGRSYRATVHIKDPALDARSLNVSLQTKGGRPVSASTTRAVEDAILSRARQLRIADKNL